MEVRQQRKVQVAMLGEGLVAPGPVHRNAQELSPMLVELGEHLVVERHLVAADWTPIRGIEGQDDRFALQIAERESLVGGDPQLEVGRGRSFGQDLGHLARPFLPCCRGSRPRALDRHYIAPGSFTLTAVNAMNSFANFD
jgi:hypothetical protein